ncbi:hypothetical protein H4R19_004947, partial [Coemansia spiralis]
MRVLGRHVHARLLNAHILRARPHRQAPGAEPQSEVVLATGPDSCAAPLVFSRVRASGTVVRLQSMATAAGAVDFMLLDDGTGVLPVALAAPPYDGNGHQATAPEMARRLALLSSASTPGAGATVEVLGSVRYSPSDNDDNGRLPPVWIECTHISAKSDPMAETTSTLAILAACHYY